jgi:hypothetical protein
MAILKFQTNVPIEVRLRSIEGKPVESQFGGIQYLFSAEEGAFYVSDTVGGILMDQLRKLGVKAGEPVDICKAEVSRGNGRKGIEWTVAKVGFAPGQPSEPPSELEQKLAASIEQAVQRKNPAQAQAAAPGWAQMLLVHTNALADVYAAALAHASTTHGNAIKPEDIRALLTTAFINLSQKGVNGRAA